MSTFVYTNQIHIPRTGTLLYGRKIGMRTFLLIAYFFIAMNMTHSQLIHEVDLTCPEEEDGKYQLSGGAKTSCNTTVHFHKIFRYSSHGMQCFAFSTRETGALQTSDMGKKAVSVIAHSFLLSQRANSEYILYISYTL